MGKKITIYESGQTYEIDSELIYIPRFLSALDNKTMQDVGMSKKLEIIKEDKNEEEAGN